MSQSPSPSTSAASTCPGTPPMLTVRKGASNIGRAAAAGDTPARIDRERGPHRSARSRSEHGVKGGHSRRAGAARSTGSGHGTPPIGRGGWYHRDPGRESRKCALLSTGRSPGSWWPRAIAATHRARERRHVDLTIGPHRERSARLEHEQAEAVVGLASRAARARDPWRDRSLVARGRRSTRRVTCVRDRSDPDRRRPASR